MQPIEFIGVRAGHCCTTTALAAASHLAQSRPVRIAAHNREDLCALAGVAVGGLSLSRDLTHASDMYGDVIDAGVSSSRRDTLRVGVLRGPDYLGVRTLSQRGSEFDVVVLVLESCRALTTGDVESISGLRVVAVVEHTPEIARAMDAGLILPRAHRMNEFAGLHSWLDSL